MLVEKGRVFGSLDSTGPGPRLLKVLVLALLLGTFTVAYLRTAWVSEDAFITFRVVDNLLSGLGPVWNPGERVQVYTHPLWFGLLTLPAWAGVEPYYASLALSYLLTLCTLALLVLTLGGVNLRSVLVLAMLLWSRAFIDYSSSGLENPLTHALLALYMAVFLNRQDSDAKALQLSGLVAALFLCRPDAIILVLPSWIAWWMAHRQSWRRLWPQALWGLAPAVLWVLFSLFYYGSPVPNTALAKVQTGASGWQHAAQAWAYLGWSVREDPVTVAVLLMGIVMAFLVRDRSVRWLGFGLLLWGLYLVRVGADYMGGRFFSGAVLIALVVMGRYLAGLGASVLWAIPLMLSSHLGTLQLTLLSPPDFRRPVIHASGIADERGFYYRHLGLLPTMFRGGQVDHPWLAEGRELASRPGWYTRCTIGMSGYAAGPAVRFVDPLALSEPFLARLPARHGARVGHYERAFPPGFLESVVSGENRIEDPVLKALYADVDLAVRAPLLAPGRIGAILRLNLGHHDVAESSFERESIGLPGVPVVTRGPFSCYGLPYGGDHTWRLAVDERGTARVEPTRVVTERRPATGGRPAS
ncbi:hypothetical protein [Caldimonas thermodepolymerans]|uniref:hypothetical protein n=1 Tax=Caldimonas thermodepolymerans TaxID=215580 RepID=UPI0024918E18|nr:hypothetical protein [Caldimonas thermodepolymerans]